MTLKIGSLYCWVSKHYYPIYSDIEDPMVIRAMAPTEYRILLKDSIFLLVKHDIIKGRDCYQILMDDQLGWIVDPASTSFIEISSNDKT